jgi:UDP-3-O-[3-hydroxymyristoyl] glucosamine N-acyltransferase
LKGVIHPRAFARGIPARFGKMERSVREIAELVGGEVIGDGDFIIKGVAPFDEAGPDDITFAALASYEKRIGQTRAAAVIVSSQVDDRTKILVRVGNPTLALARVSGLFHQARPPAAGMSREAIVGRNVKCGKDVRVCPGAFIGDGVTLGDRVTLYPGVAIGRDVLLGDDVIVYPNVSILERCRLGNRVTIHAGSVIGSDGFGFAFDGTHYHKIPQTGIVRIDDDVEIGACNTIDRATFGMTWIKRGVKTDNLVHIAHNVVVGEDTVLVAQVGISGSVSIGDHTIIAGQAGIAGHLKIGRGVTVGPQAGVGKSIPDGQVVSGSPEMPHRTWLRVANLVPKLPEMRKKITELEKRIEMLEKTPAT